VRTTLVLEPAFAVRRGVYAATASFDIARVGLRSGQVTAISQLHPGDRLDVRFAVGGPRPMRLRVDGLEAQGGAIAGSLGLAADRPFRLSVAADGERGGGRFLALATSGSARPLDASGRWTSAGGSTRGRIDLAGSSHTAPWAERLGPELQFEGTGRPVAGGGYRLVGVLATEALTVRLDGEGDPVARRTGAGGLRVSARAPALARILGLEAAQAGPAGYDGVLRGDGRNWTLDGRLAANALGVGDGYRLASATGPLMLAWRGREMVLKSDLTGAGGAGQGFTATLLGAAPRLNVEGARSSAGQLQLRALTLAGRGLEVTAKGSRGLLGGFALSGEAQARRLEEARVGASGGARATWRADQASAGAPWRLSVEARGENLALGYAELDRLLGASPKLDLAGTWGAGALALSRADLDGAALDARGQGGMTRDGSLALRADWSAQGPFRAGPVEVTGAAQGEGKISGPIGSPRVELTARIEALDIPRLPLRDGRLALVFQRQPDGGAGTASLEALSGYGPARGRTDFAFARGGLDLDALDLDAGGLKARGAVSLRRGAASRADLTLDVGPGAFLDAGRANGSLRIVDGAGGPRANLALTARNARWGGRDFVVRAASLTADGPMSRLPFAPPRAFAWPAPTTPASRWTSRKGTGRWRRRRRPSG
jgi:translocation and assembly module TamB